jgi:O-succinylhomoserine sulfhydrylase
MSDEFDFDTQAVRAGIHRSEFNEHSEALYLTSSFVFRNAAQAAARFANEEPGYVYSRFSNPTVTTFQERLAALEGGAACIATASGMSAILACVMGLLKGGDHILSSSSIFGATVQLFGTVLAKFGIETTFVDGADPAAWRRAVRPTTRLLFLETPSNPLTEVADIAALAEWRTARCRGRQLLLQARAAAAARARRRPRDPFRDQVPRWAGPGARRRGARPA